MTRTRPADLPHLLRLLDDPSPTVRQAVTDSLTRFGPGLSNILDGLPEPPGTSERTLIRELLADVHCQWLEEAWPLWFDAPQEERLERALTLLSDARRGWPPEGALAARFQDLADRFLASDHEPDPRRLAVFLFRELKFRGVEGEGYSDPAGSDLAEVLDTRRGLPLSLCVIYMLVGQRLGFAIEGCNFPAHFLARIRTEEGITLVDCARGGRFFQPEGLVSANPDVGSAMRRILRNVVSPEEIVLRALNNLVRAYHQADDHANRELMTRLRDALETHWLASHGEPAEPGAPYELGNLVRHRRYGYRGVLVSRDETCQADEGWYQSNASQPPRNQPWYSVLVHGSEQVTYAAESNLVRDDSAEPIEHPLLARFFAGFRDGSYVRNDRPWPGMR